ncbi:MAG TPA: PhzF family phenazine biosynthesis protein [Phycisphaerae bacterium]|nr:PhzF family phenazine biosynthesis protein [Phycisphaerae bacterium]
MKNDLHFQLVDAFTQSAYAGNVAGVVFDADGLTDRQMQLIAAEFNASETTFVLKPSGPEAFVRFRWFTPGCEVKFCGHATLGAVHALLDEDRLPRDLSKPGAILPIETRSGVLAVRIESSSDPAQPRIIWLDTPHNEPKATPVNLPPLLKHLGITMDMIDDRFKPIRTNDDDVMFAVKSLHALLEMRPSMSGLVEYAQRAGGLRGSFVTSLETLSAATLVQSRFFAPMAGIDEDPVTGSAHGPLGLNLVNCGLAPLIDGRADFWCAQGKAGGRAGLVRVVVEKKAGEPSRVRVGGCCVTSASGTLECLPRE